MQVRRGAWTDCSGPQKRISLPAHGRQAHLHVRAPTTIGLGNSVHNKTKKGGRDKTTIWTALSAFGVRVSRYVTGPRSEMWGV